MEYNRNRIKEHVIEAESGSIIEGRNAVRELIRAGRPVEKLFIAKDAEGSIGQIVAAAREKGIVITECDRRKLDLMSETGAHQGVIAVACTISYASIEDMLALAEKRGEKPLLVICDGMTDPHNLGAVIRSAEALGAHGVIIPKRRSAGVNATCAKAAAGATEYILISKVSNLSAVVKELKQKGLWVFGTDASANILLKDADFQVPAAIIIGSEGEGMSRIVKENCDFLIKIPMTGTISSLNASAAAAITLYEVARQRNS